MQYFPFGETWIQEGKHTERYPYLFTSKELDEESGLYYFGARYYDPRTSVWQSVDPILGEYLPNLLDEKQKGKDWKPERGLRSGGGVYKAANMSLYAYVHHNPLIFVDPSGQDVTVKLYEGASGFGHIGLAINDKGTTKGFYPEEGTSDWDVAKSPIDPVQGEWRDDTDKAVWSSITIKTTPEQDKAMMDKLGELEANPGDYNLTSRNCSTQAQEVLKAGSISVPGSILPKELMKDLKGNYQYQSHREDGLH